MKWAPTLLLCGALVLVWLVWPTRGTAPDPAQLLRDAPSAAGATGAAPAASAPSASAPASRGPSQG